MANCGPGERAQGRIQPNQDDWIIYSRYGEDFQEKGEHYGRTRLRKAGLQVNDANEQGMREFTEIQRPCHNLPTR